MKITNKTYKWNGKLSKRSKTDYIILHHAASSNISADDIHKIHLSNGWTGIGYHFYVRKSGEIYEARPKDTVGAHTSNYNSVSIGVCFEGNFESETMTKAQLDAAGELVCYLKTLYPEATVKKHRDFNATLCPGKNFPFDTIVNSKKEFSDTNEIVMELNRRNIMTNPELWLKKCSDDINVYHLAKKIANMTKNI